jgi:hypothetical protein
MSNIWTTAVGAWGDSFCAYGNICKLLRDRGEEKANVVYFGLDQNVCEFFKAQPNIDKVSWLKIDAPTLAGKYIHMACADIPQWLEVTGLKEQLPDLIPTHVTIEDQQKRPTECYRDFDPVLPNSLGNWDEFLKDKSPYILFQPYSTQSCDYSGHWASWNQALAYVLEKTDKNVVIVGEMPETLREYYNLDLLEHPKATCIVGQTKSMLDVLHIANNASLIVTTSNALSCWSVLKKIPAVVMCNSIIKEGTPYYYNWIKQSPNVVLDHNATLEHFKGAFAMAS